MYRWLVEEGMTVNGITRRLRALGIPTPCSSKFWIRQTVYRMLTNPAYTGKTYAFTKEYVEPRRRLKSNARTRKTGVLWKPKDQWVLIPNATPAIVSETTFEIAQEILRRNKQLSCRNAKRQYLLSGYIFCKRCGVRYQGYVRKWKDSGKRYEQRYYRCAKSQSIVSPVKCDNCQLNSPRIETIIWKKIENILSKPDTILGDIDDKHEEVNNTQALEQEKEEVQNRLRHLNKVKDRIYQAYYLTGDESVFKTSMAELTAQIGTLEKDKSEIESKLEAGQHYELEIEGIKRAIEVIKGNIQNSSFDDKRLALESLQIRIIVDGSDVKITGTIPLQDQPIESSAIKSPRRRWLVLPL